MDDKTIEFEHDEHDVMNFDAIIIHFHFYLPHEIGYIVIQRNLAVYFSRNEY